MDKHSRHVHRPHHNHHNHHKPFLEPSAVAMMSGERDAGSARRRRERRLRSWLRHERMTVAAELSAALHHSRDGGREPYVGPRALMTDSTAVEEEEEEEEVHEAYVVPREQKRPPPGEWPAPLSEVAGPQAAVTVGYVAAGAPAGGRRRHRRCSRQVLPLADALGIRQEEEARERVRLWSTGSRIFRDAWFDSGIVHVSVFGGFWYIFALGCGRARRRYGSGMSIAGFAGDDTPRAVFPCLSAGRARRQQRKWYVL